MGITNYIMAVAFSGFLSFYVVYAAGRDALSLHLTVVQGALLFLALWLVGFAIWWIVLWAYAKVFSPGRKW